MRVKRYSFALLLIIAVFSCSGKTEEVERVREIKNDEFKVIPLTIEADKRKLSEMIESIEVMGLEETNEGLLAGVFNVTGTDDVFVFPSGNEGSIFVYSNEGKFISTFNKKGEGPEEYGSLQSFWVKGDTILVHEGINGNIIKYDLRGDFLGEDKINPEPTHLYPYNNGYIGDMSKRSINDSLKFNIVFYDKKFKKLGLGNPYAKLNFFPISTNMNSLTNYGSNVTYKEIFGDTVFLIRDNELSPLVKLDFGKDYLWNNEQLAGDAQQAMSNLDKSGLVWLINTPKVSKSKIYLSFNTSFSDNYQFLIDRNTGKYYQIDRSKSGEDNYVFAPIRWEGDIMLASMNSYDIAELMNELGEENASFRPGSDLESIESSENPALVWVKFKDFE